MKLTKLQSLEEIVFQVNGNKKFLDKAVKEVDIICENLFSCYCGEIGEESAVMLKKAEILEKVLEENSYLFDFKLLSSTVTDA